MTVEDEQNHPMLDIDDDDDEELRKTIMELKDEPPVDTRLANMT